eukprot:11773867-Alexandrium_andersonii.AAC.1
MNATPRYRVGNPAQKRQECTRACIHGPLHRSTSPALPHGPCLSMLHSKARKQIPDAARTTRQ